MPLLDSRTLGPTRLGFADAKDQTERNAVLSEFAAQRGAEDVKEKEAAVFSKDQFEQLITKMGSVGRWKVAAVANSTTSVARGTPATPLLVNIRVSIITSCVPNGT